MENPFGIILDENNQAKGVSTMPKNNEEIQVKEVVGISTVTLIFIIIVAILFGAIAFGIGYYYSQDKELMNLSKNVLMHQLDNRYNIGLTRSGYNGNQQQMQPQVDSSAYQQQENKQFQSTKTQDENNAFQLVTKKYYVLIGKYHSQEEAQDIQNKIQLKAGKYPNIHQTPEGFIVNIGPFESESLAKNDKYLIYQKSNIMGSVIYEN